MIPNDFQGRNISKYIVCTCSGRISLNVQNYFFSEVPIRRLLKMVGDYKSEGQQLMQTLLHAPIKPRQRRDAVTEDGRFVHTGNDTTINLIPVFTLVILGVAGINIITLAKDIIHTLIFNVSICIRVDWIAGRGWRSALRSSQGWRGDTCTR